MTNPIDLVRYRNDGDDFHVLWTARRALRIFNPASNLVAVSVEAISEREVPGGGGVKDGLLVIDTAEYYGNEEVKSADQIVYCQLKYSTTNSKKPWTNGAPEFKKTLRGFAQRFAGLSAEYGSEFVTSKFRFRFVTNRPIAKNILQAVETVSSGKLSRHLNKTAQRTIGNLRKTTGLKSTDFKKFAATLELWAKEEPRAEQLATLEKDIGRYSPHVDGAATSRMKDLVRSKALSDAAENPTIRKETLLYWLGIEDDLFPAPPHFERTADIIPRAQSAEIAETIRSAVAPVVIYADGGVGKSVLAQQLPELMPEGTVSVVFDGFAGGSYRSPREPRHLHRKGLVQIINTLASQGLCDPLLPVTAPDDAYLNAFRRRLAQASLVVQARSPDAVVLVVLDAADNSANAAELRNETCFVLDLIREAPPLGCRIVALARSYRLHLLQLPGTTVQIPLNSFSLEESEQHLLSRFPEASGQEIDLFHRFTGANPRVQANAMSSVSELRELMRNLGPVVRSVNDLISGQLETALDKVIETQAGSRAEIETLCTALSILPPLVPQHVLAQAAEIPEAAVRSFVSDFGGGRPLLVTDYGIQFRDEPTEAWFHQKFAGNVDQFRVTVELLRPLAEVDGYVASAMPQLLWGANLRSELLELALQDAPSAISDPVEQREIVLRRIYFALKAALKEGHFDDAVKLFLRAGEEIATADRQTTFLMDHADLVAMLAGPDVVYDFVFRQQVWKASGTAYAFCAAMLGAEEKYHAEAHGFLGIGIDWLNEWSRSDDRNKIENDDIVAYALAFYELYGVEQSASFLGHWRPPSVSFEAGRSLTSRLLDRGRVADAEALMTAAGNNVFLKLAVALELDRICRHPPIGDVKATTKLLSTRSVAKAIAEAKDTSEISLAIVVIAEAATRYGLPTTKLLPILKRIETSSERVLRHFDQGRQRDTILRSLALRARIENRELTLDETAPKSIKDALGKPNAEHRNEVKEFRTLYGAILPWYRLRARALTKGIKATEFPNLLATAQKECSTEDWHWRKDPDLNAAISEIGVLWLESLLWAGLANSSRLVELSKWLDAQRTYITTWIALARLAGQNTNTLQNSLSFAKRARTQITHEHTDARYLADSLTEVTRAVLAFSRDEASSYFQLALENLNRLGDELHERFFAFVALARQAGRLEASQPFEAYRVARMAELFEAFNSHKFPWLDAAIAVTSLCPSSGFAISARWHDRHATYISETMPSVVKQLSREEIISPSVCAALHAFSGYWALYENTDIFLDREANKERRQEILDILLWDLEIQGRGRCDSTTEQLSKACKRNGLVSKRLDEIADFTAEESKSDSGSRSPIQRFSYRSDESFKRAPPDWDEVFKGSDLTTPQGIDHACRAFKETDTPWNWEDFYQQMQARVPVSGWSEHIRALEHVSELNFTLVLDALETGSDSWDISEAVRSAIAETIRSKVNKQPLGLIRGTWLSRRDLSRCAALAELDETDVLKLLMAGLVDFIEDMTANNFFDLAARVGESCLSPGEALSALSFGLDRLESILKDDDGDGPWRNDLTPPSEITEALASFTYAMLATPEPKTRWEAAHAVVRFCKFGQKDIVAALISQLDEDVLSAFTDRELPFYVWHARLYLTIALARAALETPDIILPHIPRLIDLSLKGTPHVLIRHFAARAILTVERFRPGTVSRKTIQRLQNVNVSQLKPTSPSEGKAVGWQGGERVKSSRFIFDYDMDRYWFDPLATAFNLPNDEVLKKAEDWIIDKWNIETDGRWVDDPRAQRGHFHDFDVMSSHGSYPDVDRLAFYLSYHSMFCAAGELLASYPTTDAKNWYHDAWPNWLERHTLTRPDGFWLADRRDPPPLEKRLWQSDASTRDYRTDWRWSVLTQDFDEALICRDKNTPNSVVVWGRWNIGDGGLEENINISSALVTPERSLALLHALQTAQNQHDYRIPCEGDESEIREEHFRMSGWIQDYDLDPRLDKFDPYSGRIGWPGSRPGKRICRYFELTVDPDGRAWRTNGKHVMWSLIWGDRKSDRYRQAENYGNRLVANLDFLLEVLSRLKRDLIVEVEIHREDGRKEETTVDYAYRFYTRLYLLRKEGDLHTLAGCRRLGAAACSGNGP